MRCGYCDMHYDVIGKMETFQEDVDFIMRAKNLTGRFPDGSLNTRQSGRKASVGMAQEDRIRKYFDLMAPGVVDRLARAYQVDFEMFGYDAEPYLTKAR